MVGDLVYVEEARAGDVSLGKFGAGVTATARHEHGRIDHHHIRLVRMIA